MRKLYLWNEIYSDLRIIQIVLPVHTKNVVTYTMIMFPKFSQQDFAIFPSACYPFQTFKNYENLNKENLICVQVYSYKSMVEVWEIVRA